MIEWLGSLHHSATGPASAHPARGCSAVEQQTHNLPVAGSIPAPASRKQRTLGRNPSASSGTGLLGTPAPKCAAGTISMPARPYPSMGVRSSNPSAGAGALTSLSASRRFSPGLRAGLFSSCPWQAGISLPIRAPRVLLKPSWAARAFAPGSSVVGMGVCSMLATVRAGH